MAGINYREQFEQYARSAHQQMIERSLGPEARLRSLFEEIANVVATAEKSHKIKPISPHDSDTRLRFKAIDFTLNSGDRVVIGVEKQGWIGQRTHEDMVYVAVEGYVDLPEGEGKEKERVFDHQFMIEKIGAYTYIHYTNSISGEWERVEDWTDKDSQGYVGYLETVFAATQKS